MKLRNKKTGEIVEVESLGHADSLKKDFGYQVTLSWKIDENLNTCRTYNTLAELNEEWEDYEEPKDFWYIDDECGIMCDATDPNLWDKKYAIEFMQQIGNYFETREEAERAVKKLKAWERLKDNGFSFNGWNWKTQCIAYNLDYTDITEEQIEEAEKDLDLLFGGEE